MESKSSPSEAAMESFIAQSPDLHEPALVKPVPGLPTLPDLKADAQARKAQGLPTIDQSAGDIAALNQPMNPDFIEYRETLRPQLVDQYGKPAFPEANGEVHGYPSNYKREYPIGIEKLAKGWGIEKTPFLGLQTVSGRNVLDLVFRGLKANALKQDGTKEPAIILDPMAWSGYKPLAGELGIKLLNGPTVEGHSLSQSEEGFRSSLEMIRDKKLNPAALVTVVPSNPTGLGITKEELIKLATAAAEEKVPLLIDAFYSPLHPEGHKASVHIGELEKELPPEILKYIGIIVGETKVSDSQKKTGSFLWMAPKGHDDLAKSLLQIARKRMQDTNTYPRPDEVLTSIALHEYPDGIHAAMGPRWEALQGARQGIKKVFDELGLPLTIGSSFYGTAALVDPSGESLIRDKEGRPIEGTEETIKALTNDHGIVGAPGLMFRSSPSAGKTVRLTATATPQDIEQLKNVFGEMLEKAVTSS